MEETLKTHTGQLGQALSSAILVPKKKKKKKINNAIALMIMDGNFIYPSGKGYLSELSGHKEDLSHPYR